MAHLTDRKIKTLPDGMHADGQGLYLRVQGNSRSFVYRYADASGKRKKKAIGKYGLLSLRDARLKALEIAKGISEGVTPEKQLKQIPTFGVYAEKYIAAMEAGWKNDKHRAQWRSTILGSKIGPDYCAPIRDLPIDEVGVEEVLLCIKDYWAETNETAKRVRGRIEKILGAATVEGLRTGVNPALLHGNLEYLLPKVRKSNNHHNAYDFRDIKSFIYEISETKSLGTDALAFLIHTAARTGEVRSMTWAQMDFEQKIWKVPAENMKAGVEHVVPLTDQAFSLLPKQKKAKGFVFTGRDGKRQMSLNTMRKVLQDKKLNVTVHGFRSTFRDWAGDCTDHDRDTVELALAHTIQNKVEAAYRRSNALEKRRRLMQDWSKYLVGVDA